MNRKQLFTTLVPIMLVLAVAAIAVAQRTSGTQTSPDDKNLMDLNSAPPEILMTLPGIDYILAKKIIASRPYKTKNDLVTKKVIPQAAYNGIVNRVTVKQDASKAAKPPAKKR